MTTATRPRVETTSALDRPGTRSGSDAKTIWAAVGWGAAMVAARGLFTIRAASILDHDQAVVGLMALDIAQGRRLPIFFDGQRYMGAIEAYVAAGFVAIFGHSPGVVALSPLLFAGLFAAGQFWAWRTWSGRSAGHLAAFLTVASAPMAAFWTAIPRGGYVELLAWAMPTSIAYRRLTRPGLPTRRPTVQFCWGFWVTLGYFINPLALVVYATLAFDWVCFRHGRDIRQSHPAAASVLDRPGGPIVWVVAIGAGLLTVASGLHVRYDSETWQIVFVPALGLIPGPWGRLAGAAIVLGAVGLVAVWTGAASRSARLLAGQPGFGLGALLALCPFLIYRVRDAMGLEPGSFGLPTWIVAPWAIGPNLEAARAVVGPLLGSDSRGLALSRLDIAADLPTAAWPGLSNWLGTIAPAVASLAGLVAVSAIVRDRRAWSVRLRLRAARPSPPGVLMTIGLAASVGLFLLQAASPHVSSSRYLVVAWIFLPGLLATGLLAIPKPWRIFGTLGLAGPWLISQASSLADFSEPSPFRALADDLDRRGVPAVVGHLPVALVVPNLTEGRVGGVEFRPYWARLLGRYRGRIEGERPVVAVVDPAFRDPSGDLGDRLRALAERNPGRVRLDRRVGRFEVWEVDLDPSTWADEPHGP